MATRDQWCMEASVFTCLLACYLTLASMDWASFSYAMFLQHLAIVLQACMPAMLILIVLYFTEARQALALQEEQQNTSPENWRPCIRCSHDTDLSNACPRSVSTDLPHRARKHA